MQSSTARKENKLMLRAPEATSLTHLIVATNQNLRSRFD